MSYSKLDRLKKELEHAISESDFDLALYVVSDMIKEDPESEKHWNSKGVILAKLDRIDESIEAFDQALEIDPGSSRSWFSKGVVLMDNGKLRAALACFYKTLDREPNFEKARNRFTRCLDQMAQQMKEPEEQDQEKWIRPPDEPREEEPREYAPEREIEEVPMRSRKKGGSFLDDDMFDEEDEEEGDIESWEEMDDDDEWEDEDEDEDYEDDDIVQYIKCRCGADIAVDSTDRPFRFVCDECGRTGTLK